MLLPPDIQPDENKEIFLLLDGAQFENLGQKIYSSNSLHARALYGGTRLQAALHVSPYLVKLSEESSLLDEFLDQGVWAYQGYLLESDANLETTADHLAWLCVAKHSEADFVALRFFDPRIFPGLFEALPETEQALFLGPVRKVWIPDPEGEEWQMMERPEIPGPSLPDYSKIYTLNSAQERAMDKASWDFFIKGLSRDLGKQYPDLPADDAGVFFYAEKALALGFTQEEDIYGFCHLCCLLAQKGTTPWETNSSVLQDLMRYPNSLSPTERIQKALSHIMEKGDLHG